MAIPGLSGSAMEQTLVIRELAASDVEAVAKLSGELGYPVSPAVMQHRMRKFLQTPAQAAYVACTAEGEVAGWIEMKIVQFLAEDAQVEIGGLIVSGDFRNRGIGKRLLARAEQWAKEQGVSRIVVRSRSTREAAHRFYLREGYAQVKTSAVFAKEVP
jgi:GNAT superfamily N-acetyltransferase